MKALQLFIGAAVLSVLTAGTVHAQAVSGSQVSGVVKDETGAVLPGATVTMTQTDTGSARTIVTDANGSYILPNLPVGPYQGPIGLRLLSIKDLSGTVDLRAT